MKGSRIYPVGAGTYSKHPDRYAEGAPRRVTWASGAWVGDELEFADGLVDLTSGMGAVILGHGHRAVTARMKQQIDEGFAFPLPSHLEEAVAERLLSMLKWPRAESVRFGKNGADVTTSAVRLARAVTGRDLVLYCDYHGHHDWCMGYPPMNGGVPEAGNADTDYLSKRVPRGEIVDYVARPEWADPAAVVLEPYPSAPGENAPVDWAALRKACDETGTLLILDEMVSGFRCDGGGAEFFGIEPDIACYGKAMANGMPLSAIVGPHDFLKRYEEDVFFSVTHGGEAVSLAAAHETMKVLASEQVPTQLKSLGWEIIDLFESAGAAHRVRYGYPQRLLFDFTKEELGFMLAYGKVLSAGYANLTLAHCEDHVARNRILVAIRAVLRRGR